ncbi:2Fe-2S iron-sulfur cluster-binding protein [Falsiroseomonas sp. CW058]|uniref:2Fe-2S iron-sulfur cluster-binding protein n=1 Tax=Falsiroseomonas sp. CW058 TaxID=3388664 RepID=UPI003D313C43
MNAVVSTRFHPLRVVAVTRETPDAVAITLRPPPQAEALFRFAPGQYLTLRRVIDGAEQRRSYSICSAPEDGTLRIGVKRVPGGLFSTWAVEGLKPGDVVEAMPPEGRFGLQPDAPAPRTVLAIACGSGITPVLSILSSLLARDPASRAVLLYGNRSAADIMFRTAIEDLKDRHLSRLSVVHVLSREKHELAALHGRLDAARIRALLPGLVEPAAIDAAFLCGPAGLPDAAAEALAALGVPPGRIHTEHFTAAGPARAAPAPPPAAAAEPAATAAITLDGVTREIALLPGETVLEGGLRAGMDLPWSCRGGMCCTCRARLTEGAVAMDANYSLQPWELAGGYVLTCQSRPTTKTLALDYDAA